MGLEIALDLMQSIVTFCRQLRYQVKYQAKWCSGEREMRISLNAIRVFIRQGGLRSGVNYNQVTSLPCNAKLPAEA